MSVISDALGEITVQAPSDPDAQATVTDFLDYTEYLPADLIRSLTLIRKMDVTYLASAAAVHDLTRSYGSLPSLEPDKRPDPRTLRLQISQELDSALHARECGYAEASRLYDVIDRHFNRLTSIIAKLHALPQPPSRDPTPVPQPVSSPQTHRSRGGRKLELEGVGQPRITLRLDGSRTVGPGRPPGSSGRPKQRHRRITIPGEVLPPPNPDSPEPMSDSGWESEALSPIPMATSRVGAPYRSEKKELKKIKLPKLPKIKLPASRSRPPGMGTNVHSAVAGISSSNALALLKPPPEDAQLGSKHRPWLRLTEWEMAKLRKRMKKNAVWTPSDTMIRRELSELGRGPENYRTAKARAETTGEPLLDEDNIEATSPSKKVLAPGEIHPDSVGADEMQLSNRGMKLNEAKKLKKEIMAREAALAAAEAEQAAQRLAEAGSAFKNIFSPQLDDVADSVTVTPEKSKEKESGRGERKRKRDADSDNLESEGMGADTKKRRYTVSDGETITTVPLAAPGPSADSIKKGISTAAGGRPRRASMTPKVVSPVMSRPPSRPRSRGTLGRHSAEPAFGRNRGPARRGSTASVHAQLESTGARRRSKRPAPGLVRANEDGSMTVSIGKRKAAPRKKTGGKKPKAEEANATNTEAADGWEEPIDPNEPRYCICGDVSWGTMVACENEDCVQEWFHLECVGLTAEPGPRTKWYCPECREKFGIGNNGLVASRRR